MIARVTASILGGLGMALAGGALITLCLPGPELDNIVAGALTTEILWVVGIVMGIMAPTGASAWRRIGGLSVFFLVCAACFWS